MTQNSTERQNEPDIPSKNRPKTPISKLTTNNVDALFEFTSPQSPLTERTPTHGSNSKISVPKSCTSRSHVKPQASPFYTRQQALPRTVPQTPSQNFSNVGSSSQRQNEEEDGEDINSIVNSLIEGSRDVSTVDCDLVPAVIGSLYQIRDNHLFDHDVDLAQKADELAADLIQFQKNEQKLMAQRQSEQTAQQRLQQAESEMKNLEERWERVINQKKQKHRKQMSTLEQRHFNEIDEFNAKWQTPKTIRQYSTASPKLRLLRSQNVNLLMARRYEELRKNDQEIAELENDEKNEQIRVMSVAYDDQLKQLQEKHRYEVEVMHTAQEIEISKLRVLADNQIDNIKKRIQSLERKVDFSKDPEKVWNLHHRHQNPIKQRSMTSVRISRANFVLNQHALNTLDLPPLGTGRRCVSQYGNRAKSTQRSRKAMK